MSINPVLTDGKKNIVVDNFPGKRSCASSGASGFDVLMDSARRDAAASATNVQKAAAELLRMEMMQTTLSLAGDNQAAAASDARPLLSALCGNGYTAFQGRRQVERRLRDGNADSLAEATGAVTIGKGELSDEIGRTAAGLMGTPYRFGGEGADGLDCSSFVQRVFREHDITLPRTAREQIAVGVEVTPGNLQKGDLVFFQTYAAYPSHVGIYLGDGKMVHASSEKGEVTISDINSDYYRSRYIGAKRVA